MSTTAGHAVSGSSDDAAAGARFGAQAGTAPGPSAGGDSGSGSRGASSVEAIFGVAAGGGDFGAELLDGTAFAAETVFGDEVHGVGAFFAAGGGSEGDAGGSVFVGAAAAGGTVAGGTVARRTVTGGTVVGGTVAGGTVLAAGGWLAGGAPRGATGGGFHSDGVGPAGRSGSCASVSPNAEGGHAGIVCSVGGSGGQMSLGVGSSASGCAFGGQVNGADLVGTAG